MAEVGVTGASVVGAAKVGPDAVGAGAPGGLLYLARVLMGLQLSLFLELALVGLSLVVALPLLELALMGHPLSRQLSLA